MKKKQRSAASPTFTHIPTLDFQARTKEVEQPLALGSVPCGAVSGDTGSQDWGVALGRPRGAQVAQHRTEVSSSLHALDCPLDTEHPVPSLGAGSGQSKFCRWVTEEHEF